jgi:hypothetical protein
MGLWGMLFCGWPLALYAIEKGIHKPSMWTFILISISVRFLFSLVIFKLAFMSYWLLLPILFSGELGFCCFFGIRYFTSKCLQILPSLEFYQQAARSEIFAKGEIIPWKYLLTLFSPDFYGNPVTRND